jgi:hypothetical protein
VFLKCVQYSERKGASISHTTHLCNTNDRRRDADAVGNEKECICHEIDSTVVPVQGNNAKEDDVFSWSIS